MHSFGIGPECNNCIYTLYTLPLLVHNPELARALGLHSLVMGGNVRRRMFWTKLIIAVIPSAIVKIIAYTVDAKQKQTIRLWIGVKAIQV